MIHSAIKIIKRDTLRNPNNLPVCQPEKTPQERERETASTVKGWVAEWEERKRSLQIATFEFVRALDESRQTSIPAVN